MTRIFVYGSLREGMYNHKKYLEHRVSKSELAYVKGQLYSLKGKAYPALLPGNDWIVGEIFTIADTKVLQELDELEEWYGEGNVENEYNKTFMDVFDKDKQYLDTLPVYTFNMEKPAHQDMLEKQIEHGDYVKHNMQYNASKL